MGTGEMPTPPTHRAATSAVYLGVAQAVRMFTTILSTIVISRLLTPDDYGVIAMVAPITGFLFMFQDLGLTTATIQKATMNHNELNAVFWMNIFTTVGVALVMVAVSPLVGLFYHDSRAAYVAAATALTVIIGGISMQHGALLNREMRFATLSGIDIVSALVTFFVAAILAYLTHSYWALFIGSLAGLIVQSLMTWRASQWRPTLKFSLRDSRELMQFGGHVTGFNLVNYFVRNADNILIARFAGTAAIGLYDRSYKLMMLPIQNINAPISRLLLPILSRSLDDPVGYRNTFVFAIRVVALLTIPGIAIAAVLSDRLIPFLLGERWAAAGPIFFWLGLTGIIQPIANLTGLLFLSTARTRVMMHFGTFSAIVTLIGFAIGLQWGAVGVAASLFITATARLPMTFFLAGRNNPVRQWDLYAAQLEPVIGTGIAVAIALMLAPKMEIVPLLCLVLPLAYVAAISVSLTTSEGRSTAWKMLGIVRGLIAGVADFVRKRSSRGRPAQPAGDGSS